MLPLGNRSSLPKTDALIHDGLNDSKTCWRPLSTPSVTPRLPRISQESGVPLFPHPAFP